MVYLLDASVAFSSGSLSRQVSYADQQQIERVVQAAQPRLQKYEVNLLLVQSTLQLTDCFPQHQVVRGRLAFRVPHLFQPAFQVD